MSAIAGHASSQRVPATARRFDRTVSIGRARYHSRLVRRAPRETGEPADFLRHPGGRNFFRMTIPFVRSAIRICASGFSSFCPVSWGQRGWHVPCRARGCVALARRRQSTNLHGVTLRRNTRSARPAHAGDSGKNHLPRASKQRFRVSRCDRRSRRDVGAGDERSLCGKAGRQVAVADSWFRGGRFDHAPAKPAPSAGFQTSHFGAVGTGELTCS